MIDVVYPKISAIYSSGDVTIDFDRIHDNDDVQAIVAALCVAEQYLIALLGENDTQDTELTRM